MTPLTPTWCSREDSGYREISGTNSMGKQTQRSSNSIIFHSESFNLHTSLPNPILQSYTLSVSCYYPPFLYFYSTYSHTSILHTPILQFQVPADSGEVVVGATLSASRGDSRGRDGAGKDHRDDSLPCWAQSQQAAQPCHQVGGGITIPFLSCILRSLILESLFQSFHSHTPVLRFLFSMFL